MIDWDAKVIAPLMAQFGETEKATYQPANGVSFDIDGVFDNPYREVENVTDGSVVATIAPMLGVRLSQFAVHPKQKDTLIVPRTGKRYMVKNVKPDGLGWALLELNSLGAI